MWPIGATWSLRQGGHRRSCRLDTLPQRIWRGGAVGIVHRARRAQHGGPTVAAAPAALFAVDGKPFRLHAPLKRRDLGLGALIADRALRVHVRIEVRALVRLAYLAHALMDGHELGADGTRRLGIWIAVWMVASG